MKDEQFNKLSQLVGIEQEKLEHIHKLAKLQVLSEIKKNLMRWIQAWAVVITVGFSLLAAFGIDQLVINRVQSQVDSQLEHLDEHLKETEVKSLAVIQLLDGQLAEKEKEIDALTESMIPFIEDLRTLNVDNSLLIVLRRLVADFYIVRSAKVAVRLKFSADLSEVLESTDIRSIRNLALGVYLIDPEDPTKSLAQFGADHDDIATLTEGGVTDVIYYDANIYSFFRPRVYDKLIRDFRFGAIELVTGTSDEQTLKKLALALEHFENAECEIFVNEVPIHTEVVANSKFEKNEINGSFYLAARQILENEFGTPEVAFENAIPERFKELTD